MAEDALELIEVDYDPLPALVNPIDSVENKTVLIRDDIKGLASNVSFRYELKAGDTGAAFENADYIYEEAFETGRQHVAPLETSGTVANYDPIRDTLTVWSTFQIPFQLRAQLAQSLGMPESRIRVIVPDMGGAFGSRGEPYAHHFIAALLSKATKRPVKITLDRREDLVASGHRILCSAKLSVAVRKDGLLLGLRGKFLWDTGAWHGIGSASLSKGLLQMAGPYKIDNVSLEGLCVYTNKSYTSSSRGFGQPQMVFIRERLIDIVAKKLGIDPLELRLRNVVRPEDVPYKSSTGPMFDSPHFAACLREAARAVGWQKILNERRPNVGLGIALYQKNNSGYDLHGRVDYDTVRVQIEPDGSVSVYTGAVPQGQGHHTVLAQIAAEDLGVDIGNVSILTGDTQITPHGMGTWGSRTTVVSGGALHLACRRIKEKMIRIAAHNLGAKEEDIVYAEGRLYVRDTQEGLSFMDVVKIAYANTLKLPTGLEPTLIATATYDPPGKGVFDDQGRCQVASTYDIGAYAVVVQVDPETAIVKILDHALSYDCGKIVNPMIVEGQHHGGLAHGIGMAMYENLVWDETGQILNPTFADFACVSSVEMPTVRKLIEFQSNPSNLEWGYRGVGESAGIGVPAAIANAVSNAMRVEINELPLAPEKLYSKWEQVESQTSNAISQSPMIA